MPVISLKIRQGFILVFLLVVALPILFISIGKSYYASLVNATENTLEAHIYTLVAEVDFAENSVEMPQNLFASELNRINSDTFAYIYQDEKKRWQSESSLNQDLVPQIGQAPIGETLFEKIQFQDKEYWQMRFSLVYETNQSSHTFSFYLLKDNASLLETMQEFRQTLVDWLIIMGVVITVLLMIGFVWSARPLQRLDHEIKEIELGQATEITGRYPIELIKIQQDLNLLLASQQRQKEQYRKSLSDLAHALKTPLAVLKSSEMAHSPENNEQLDRINHMIEHQLKRAATGATDTWKKHTTIKPVCDSIINAMSKVYRDKAFNIDLSCSKEMFFLGDKTDLMEILGNLIDNACKACVSHVVITISTENHSLIIEVADDGPGIKAKDRASLVERGKRLDSYEAGHGIGMAIVNDLVSAYQGQLTISDSPLGGALFNVTFKQNVH